MAYAGPEEGLMRANARLGRIAVAGAVAVAPFGYLVLKLWGRAAPIYLAAVAYAHLGGAEPPAPASADAQAEARGRSVARGRIPQLTGAGDRRGGAAGGERVPAVPARVLAPRRGEPTWWFGVLAAAGVLGGFLADLFAPRLPTNTREEAVVVACVIGAGVGALLAFEVFGLPVLTVFAFVAGAASELGRLAFQSLMQRHAPEGAHGRVFVRYEVLFQLAWVAGAFIPALLPIAFRPGILILGGLLPPRGRGVLRGIPDVGAVPARRLPTPGLA